MGLEFIMVPHPKPMFSFLEQLSFGFKAIGRHISLLFDCDKSLDHVMTLLTRPSVNCFFKSFSKVASRFADPSSSSAEYMLTSLINHKYYGIVSKQKAKLRY